ncbi:MAG TPA: cell division protein FtsQ, partial [Pusillimonas sp.]|nr:cell division protein FtsQ [Pusillimonas sp.]
MVNEARVINFLANTLALLAVVAMIAGFVVWLIQRPYFSITQIKIEPMEL